MTDEFEEVAYAGGKLHYIHKQDGLYIQFSHSNLWGLALYQVCVAYDGQLLSVLPQSGIGPMPPYPKPSLLAFVISDRQQMFGMQCPNCRSYFRTDYCGAQVICPYCMTRRSILFFVTPNQREFIAAQCRAFVQSYESGQDLVIDLDQIELGENRAGWKYTEVKQQHQFLCECGPKSKIKCDILGEYGGCPHCGRRNYRQVIEAQLTAAETEFRDADAQLKERHDREIAWERLTRCISEFEALANDVRKVLLLIPATPPRKAELANVSFQRILKASESLDRWFGFKMLHGLSEEDGRFLNRMFNRRHLFTHNGGRVDQEYIDNTDDRSVRLNEKVRLRSAELRRLLALLRVVAENLIAGVESIR